MDINEKMKRVEASAIREILKRTSNPSVISFAGGNPSKEAFPIEEIQDISKDILENDPVSVLQYGITEGDKEFLNEANTFFNRKFHNTKENDQIMVTTGSQQIMDLFSKVLCNENDYICVEEPSFLGALNSFKENGAQLIGVDFKKGQLDLDALEKAFQRKPKFFYTIPNFQNPMGTTMSLDVRQKVLDLAYQYHIPILEDDPYGAIRFRNEDLPSLKSLDTHQLVFYGASLSKIFAPGLRLAVCIGDHSIISKMIVAKQGADVHTNLWAQKVVSEYFKRYSIDNHIAKIQKIYKDKCEYMLENIQKYFPRDITYTNPEGGMFIWVTLPERIDKSLFINEALKQNVAVVPGEVFYTKPIDCSSFRLNFSMPSKQDIEKGIRILGQLMK